jgi:hypothetical protein
MLHALLIFLSLNSPDAPNLSLWGGDGHRLICEIAWQHLTPEAKRLATQLRHGESGTFSESCTWADEVRDARPETYNYHFINIPARQRGMSLARDCAGPKYCAPWAIKHYTTILADTTQSRLARSEALKFVGHFVGDLHQPLHAGRPEDRGGNDVKVSFFGDAGSAERRLNLHGIWDSGILRRAAIRWPGSANELLAGITSSDVAAWANADVVAWTNESYRIAQEFVYTAGPGSDIAEPYYQRALQIAQHRMQQGGIRLAFLLNEAARGRTSFTF